MATILSYLLFVLVNVIFGAFSLEFELFKRIDGNMTIYADDASGPNAFGACGTHFNAAKQTVVAISHEYWVADNTNNEKLCNFCVGARVEDRCFTAKALDRCGSCQSFRLDMGWPTFFQLDGGQRGSTEQGDYFGPGYRDGQSKVSWMFLPADYCELETVTDIWMPPQFIQSK